MAQDPISAAGARLDGLLQAQVARTRQANLTSASAGVQFALPNKTGLLADSVSSAATINFVPNTTPPVPAELGLGATFRRSGSSLDVPMRVIRVGDGLVFANYTDEDGTREMAFMATQIDVVTKAPPDGIKYEVPFVMPSDLSQNPAKVAPPPPPAVSVAPNVTPPVPAAFGVGATVCIPGITPATPMTVTRVGDGVVFANYTDDEGTREMPFMWKQLVLATPAP